MTGSSGQQQPSNAQRRARGGNGTGNGDVQRVQNFRREVMPDHPFDPEALLEHAARVGGLDPNEVMREDPNAHLVDDLNDTYDGPDDLPQTIADRARNVAIYSNKFTWDFIKTNLHKMFLSGLPADVIGQRFGVSVNTIYKWKTKMERGWSNAALEFDATAAVMESLDNLKVLRAEAWQRYTLASGPRADVIKGKWMDTIRSIEAEQHRILQAAGAYVDEPLSRASLEARRTAKTTTKSNVDVMKEMMQGFLATDPTQEGFDPSLIEGEFKDMTRPDEDVMDQVPDLPRPQDVQDSQGLQEGLDAISRRRRRRPPEQARADFEAWNDTLSTPDDPDDEDDPEDDPEDRDDGK